MLSSSRRTTRRIALCVALTAATGFALAGCGENDEHAGHDHSAHDESGDAAEPAKDTGDPAGLAADGLERIEPSADYASKNCPISGEVLGSMGDPIAIRYEGREVQFCCQSCLADFAADPAAALAKLDADK